MKQEAEFITTLNWTEVPGQEYSNRARYHLRRLMHERGYPFSEGLNAYAARSMYNFVHEGADITLFKLELIAEELDVKVETMLLPIPGEHRGK